MFQKTFLDALALVELSSLHRFIAADKIERLDTDPESFFWPV